MCKRQLPRCSFIHVYHSLTTVPRHSPSQTLLSLESVFSLCQNVTNAEHHHTKRCPDLTPARGRAWLSGRSPGAPQSPVPRTTTPLQPLPTCSSNSTANPELSSLSWTELTCCKIHTSERCDWALTKAPVNRNLLLASPTITTLFAPKSNMQATTKWAKNVN